MKKYLLAFLAVALIASAVGLFPSQSGEKSASGSPGGGGNLATSTKHQPVDSVAARRTEVDKSGDVENEALEKTYEAERERDRMERIKRDDRDYNTPIMFYGRAVDLNDSPVLHASVDYSSTSGSFSGTRQLPTGADGRFTISGIRGKYLDIVVSHPGYYEQQDSRRGFTYAGVGNGPIHTPDSAHP